MAAGDAATALKAYDAAFQIETGDADLHANAGLAASEIGVRALFDGETAIALNPKHAAAHNNLAAELTALGRLDDALSHARLAAEHVDDPDFSANLATIERLCAKRGRPSVPPG